MYEVIFKGPRKKGGRIEEGGGISIFIQRCQRYSIDFFLGRVRLVCSRMDQYLQICCILSGRPGYLCAIMDAY